MNWQAIVAAGGAIWAIIKGLKRLYDQLPVEVRKEIEERLGEEWKDMGVRLRLYTLHRTLENAWKEALKGPSIDESYPGSHETAEVLRATHKIQEKTVEAIIELHRDDMKGRFESLPDDWRERVFDDPPAQWARETDVQQAFIFHLLFVAALAHIGGHVLHHSRTRDLCFACLAGKEEACYLRKHYKEDVNLLPLIGAILWKHRFSKPKDACFKFGFRPAWGTVRGIDRDLMEEHTTEDIIAAARAVFVV